MSSVFIVGKYNASGEGSFAIKMCISVNWAVFVFCSNTKSLAWFVCPIFKKKPILWGQPFSSTVDSWICVGNMIVGNLFCYYVMYLVVHLSFSPLFPCLGFWEKDTNYRDPGACSICSEETPWREAKAHIWAVGFWDQGAIAMYIKGPAMNDKYHSFMILWQLGVHLSLQFVCVGGGG